jgi:Regulator of ribonuclease activity B
MGLKDLFRRQPGGYSTPAEGDRLILEQLRGLGADLSRPRHAIQFLYFPDEAGARGAAETLAASGYEVEVRPPGEGIAQWAAVAETQAVVDEEWIGGMRPRMDAVAHANGGEYDGWEAAAD